MADDPPKAAEPCNGITHAWRVLSASERDEQYPGWHRAALATCCGAVARHNGIEWVVEPREAEA